MVTNFLPRVWNAFSSNTIFVLHCLLPFQKNFFFARVLLSLSSFLQGNPKGSVVILLITSKVITTDRPFTTAMAWVLVRGMSERTNYLATSSSYPHSFKEPHPIVPCENFYYRRVLMNSYRVCGFSLVKTPCHITLVIVEACVDIIQEFWWVREI